jgi:rhodanese-related sulfurtransferase
MRPKLLLFLAPLLFFGLSACAQQDRVDASTFQARMKEAGAQLVDVRTPEEFAKGYIAGAVNNDWLEEGFLDRAKTLDKSKPVLLYCAAGGRSEEAVAAMKKAGYTNVVDLEGGFNGWKRSNLPVATK